MDSVQIRRMRVGALRRFAAAISILTILGHLVLGFEAPIAYVVVALITAYCFELSMETIDAWSTNRSAGYRGSIIRLLDFLLPAHITALAIAMLLYSNERLWPVAFAVIVALGSKHIFRITTSIGKRKHFLNPSNTGIVVVLLLFPWVGISPPYQYTENVSGSLNWILPLLFIVAGTFLNAKFTKKIPLISAWLMGFFLQAVVRSWLYGTPVAAALNPMTGVAFLLFTFYMISDPGTTPFKWRAQVLFGFSVAFVYGLLMAWHVVFGLFFALLPVCVIRGVYIFWEESSLSAKLNTQQIGHSEPKISPTYSRG